MVKIERKKGLKKMRISHNKKLFWIIIALIIILGFLVFFIFSKRPDKTVTDNVFECEKDSDCTRVQTGCCSCNMGGEEKCIPVSEKQKYDEILKKCSERTICLAMYACNIQSCLCINNSCSPLSLGKERVLG